NDVNDPPVAVNDTASTNEDTPVDISILTNDSDPDGTLNVTSVDLDPATPGQQTSFTVVGEGTYTVDNAGVVTFDPAENFNGVTTPIDYTVDDNDGLTSNVATVTITVTAQNDPPVATDDTYIMDQDTSIILTPLTEGVADSDPDNDTLVIASINGKPVILGTPKTILVPNGSVNYSATGVVTFTPTPGYVGTSSFPYTISDGNGGTDDATENITVLLAPAPALTLEKTANTATYNVVGDIITYSYKVTNSGNVILDGPFTIADNKITVSNITVSLAPGAFETVTATYAVTQADLDNGNIINIASATDTVTGTTSPEDTVTVTAVQNPALTLEKSANVTSYSTVDEVITYSYKVTNSGNVTLDGPFTIADNKITVSDITVALAPGEFETVTATHTITQADLDNGNIINIASATDTVTGTTSLTDTVTVDANQNPALTLKKTSDEATYAAVGEVITYRYKVTNSGNVTLDGPFTIADNKITVSDITVALAPGEFETVTATHTITQADLDNGNIINIASATDTVTGTTSLTDTVTVDANQNPALTFEKTANVTTYNSVGEVIIYSYKIINSGNVTLDGPFSISDDKITVADAIGSIAPGESLTVTQTYRITQADIDAGFITNIASASNGTATSPTDTVTITADVNPALTLDKTANVTTYDTVGDQIIYSYKVTNSGDVVISGPISITDDKITVSATIGTLSPGASITVTQAYIVTQADLDAGFITNVASASNGVTTSPTDTVTVTAVESPALTLEKTANVSTYTAIGDQIIYSYKVINSGNVALAGPFTITDDKITVADGQGPLSPGASVTVTETYTITQADLDAGLITNVASVTDGTTTSPTDTVTVNIYIAPAPALTLEKTANTATYSVGDVIIYNYRVINSGNVTLDGPFAINDDKISIAPAVGILTPGESVTVTQTYITTQADYDAGSITNIASTTDGTTTSPEVSLTINAVDAPALTLEKTANVNTYTAVGDQIIYTYKVINSGNVALAGPFVITDDKITVQDAPGPLFPGESSTVTETYTVTQADLDAGSITNIAFASYGATTSPTDAVTVNVFVVPAPALTLEKTANATTYSTVGEVIIYSYKIINSGNVTLDGPFSITDDKIAVADAIGSIAPGESLTVTQTYIITQADIDAGSITNVASTSNGTTTSPTDTVTITADVNPALTLDKTANVTTYDTVGDQIIYSYKVTNSGDVLISGPISITDDKITVSATIGTLSPGVSITVTQTYIITQADLDAGSITNVASATNGVTTSPTDTVTVTATTPTGLGSIGDTVWYDTDGDGIVDAGEPGLMGVTVTLDPGTPGNPTDDVPAITDVNGNYLFENLPVGVYTVTVDISTLTGGLPAGKTLADIIPISDGDGVGTPNTITLTLPSGQNNLDQDFAYGVSSGNTGTGNNGGVESESLGDAISKIYVGRKKNSMPTEFVKSSENLYNKVKL
ncbi:S-layer family protein, partial [uncultured Polaribacter sp.]|uniref:beta strand repeat-containing protein n=1 Tax=uncultured Polaribacter sp. TaxID=174711 RepID=UPI002602EF74